MPHARFSGQGRPSETFRDQPCSAVTVTSWPSAEPARWARNRDCESRAAPRSRTDAPWRRNRDSEARCSDQARQDPGVPSAREPFPARGARHVGDEVAEAALGTARHALRADREAARTGRRFHFMSLAPQDDERRDDADRRSADQGQELGGLVHVGSLRHWSAAPAARSRRRRQGTTARRHGTVRGCAVRCGE